MTRVLKSAIPCNLIVVLPRQKVVSIMQFMAHLLETENLPSCEVKEIFCELVEEVPLSKVYD